MLTVEYDVRDDLPTETSVFKLEPTSLEIVLKIINNRFQHISQVDASRIAKFSGGNARQAIALANTMNQEDSLSGMRDQELFERLFKQKNDASKSLLESAEVCSLVYSFEGTEVNSEKSELQLLASLIGKSGSDLYRDVNELYERDLIQSRDVWRALLPHAIANTIASRALDRIPKNVITEKFLYRGSERLIKSFTHRLSYLHESDVAVQIAEEWLSKDGWLGEVKGNLSSFGLEVFRNLAPVSPAMTLKAIQRYANGDNANWFTSRENPHLFEFTKLLRLLAYDPELFEPSVKLMCDIALGDELDHDTYIECIGSLFYVRRSGTHASTRERAAIIEELVNSEDENQQKLGILLLDATLQTWRIHSYHDFEFGSRSRNYGYEPKTQLEMDDWFNKFIDICTRLAIGERSIADQAKTLISNNLRGLWTNVRMFESLELSVQKIHTQKAWNDCWVSVRETMRYDLADFDEDTAERLTKLEKALRPANLLERARTFALSNRDIASGIDDEIGSNSEATDWDHAEQTTQELGFLVSQDSATLAVLLPELVSTPNTTRLYVFGRGLAEGCGSKEALWQAMYAQFGKTSSDDRQIDVLLGFVSFSAVTDPLFVNSILDGLVNDELLGNWFPLFQRVSPIDRQGLKRLHDCLDIGRAEIQTFERIAYGRVHETISDDDLAILLRKILSKESGINVVLIILTMRFHSSKRETTPKYSKKLLETSQEVLATYPFARSRDRHGNSDYRLTNISKVCLNGIEAVKPATAVCLHLLEAITNNDVYTFDCSGFLKSLCRLQPFVFLDVFIGNNKLKDFQLRRVFKDYNDPRRAENPLDQITNDDLITWCEHDPDTRYPLISISIQSFSESKETNGLDWKPIVFLILEKAPNLGMVLEPLADTGLSSWFNSATLQNHFMLFQSLHDHGNAQVRAWATGQCGVIQKIIDKKRELESRENHTEHQRFE